MIENSQQIYSTIIAVTSGPLYEVVVAIKVAKMRNTKRNGSLYGLEATIMDTTIETKTIAATNPLNG